MDWDMVERGWTWEWARYVPFSLWARHPKHLIPRQGDMRPQVLVPCVHRTIGTCGQVPHPCTPMHLHLHTLRLWTLLRGGVAAQLVWPTTAMAVLLFACLSVCLSVGRLFCLLCTRRRT